MMTNGSIWNLLRLDDRKRLLGASACAYVGMTPGQIKVLLEPVHANELDYKIGVAIDLGFNPEKDLLRVNT